MPNDSVDKWNAAIDGMSNAMETLADKERSEDRLTLTIDVSNWPMDKLQRVGDYATNRKIGLGEAIGELVEHGLADIDIWGTNVR